VSAETPFGPTFFSSALSMDWMMAMDVNLTFVMPGLVPSNPA
jgi:hypothetical protein